MAIIFPGWPNKEVQQEGTFFSASGGEGSSEPQFYRRIKLQCN